MQRQIIMDVAKDLLDKNNHLKIDINNKKELKHEEGDYYIIKYDEYAIVERKNIIIRNIITALSRLLKKLTLNKSSKILIVGLGSSEVVADSLGPNVTKKLIATNHIEDFITIPKVAIFTPNIITKTGINPQKMIKYLVEELDPDVIIFIDSMLTSDINNLNNIIEINDEGIIPGSYLNYHKVITKKTYNKPIISIGIPLVIEKDKNLFTIPTINQTIEITSQIISEALNKLFYE